MKNESIKELGLTDLLDSAEQYIIPIYQRNYAWEAKEIEQLIQDIIDYSINHPEKNYYIGTLVVATEQIEIENSFQTIDGQQRLTTLSILSAVIKNRYKEVDLEWFNSINLDFASREKSKYTMEAVYEGKFLDGNYEPNIKAAYEICEKGLEKRINDNEISILSFTKYLYKYVKIIRVPLPPDTKLNHYFEIMNSRGEQLEKHERLKATLMECFTSLDKNDQEKYSECFNLIWEACSNMEKYVQYGFTTDQRHLIFGENNWNSLAVYNFDEFVRKVFPTLLKDESIVELSIDEILAGNTIIELTKESEESPDRFNSVINFQNFLLHVLRVQTAKDEVALDDKRLIEIFENELKQNPEDKIIFVKEFIFNLLKSKLLFDKYIIKREFTANMDRWSLKSLKWYSSGKVKNGVSYVNTFGDENGESFDSDNRRVLMLLSMFHVSQPSMSYKYWLNASLNYLFNQFEISGKDYILYLEHIAKSFVFDKYLSQDPAGFFKMIYKNLHPIHRNELQINLKKLRFPEVDNMVFNFVDYLLWSELKDKDKDNRVKTFEFTFRSSVEHYYPQNPKSPDVVKIDPIGLHSFGNLCLISHSKNSSLNNYSPTAKKDHYSKNATLDSLKQFLMMKELNWSLKEIRIHDKKMIDLLSRNMSSDFKPNDEISIAQKWFKEFQVRDRLLLVRALLCFSDYPKPVSGDKYNLFDFDFIRQNEVFEYFEEYVEKKSPKNLSDIISKHLSYKRLQKEYRYLFIKYPEIIEYCKGGNFLRKNNGKEIFLLEAERNSTHNSKELYIFLLEKYFLNNFKKKFFSLNTGLYIDIDYNEDGYYLTEDNKNSILQIKIWNNGELGIEHRLISKINGNRKEVKLLEDYKWIKKSEGYFERFGKSKLLGLEQNYEENLVNAKEAIIKLLKNGLGIKLSRAK